MTEKVRKLWFIRQDKEIRGPFPSATISQFLLIGRVRMSDEVSQDKENWQKIRNIPELIPDVMKADLTDPVNRANLEAARHGADERKWGEDEFDDSERRSSETAEEYALRQLHASKRLDEYERKTKQQKIITLAVLLVICAAVIIPLLLYTPGEKVPDIDCSAPQAPGVNWSNCNFQGANLDGAVLIKAHIRNANFTSASLYQTKLSGVDFSYTNLGLANLRLSDLTNASLVGAVLRNSDLRGADLSGADLSYADLQGAQLTDTNLRRAKLDKAIWINGQVCAQGSVGGCLGSQ
ncbi:MAG: pentapeptide repeat-containing protein [Anaerolineae bacterium]|nr:pentapeptide repeat-containing protein [Anaerolineae bacterium]